MSYVWDGFLSLSFRWLPRHCTTESPDKSVTEVGCCTPYPLSTTLSKNDHDALVIELASSFNWSLFRTVELASKTPRRIPVSRWTNASYSRLHTSNEAWRSGPFSRQKFWRWTVAGGCLISSAALLHSRKNFFSDHELGIPSVLAEENALPRSRTHNFVADVVEAINPGVVYIQTTGRFVFLLN